MISKESSTTPVVEINKIVDVDAKTSIDKSLTTKEFVQNYFSDIPIMAEVARCESRFRQFYKDGQIVRGETNSKDVGVMQINELYHSERAEKLGFDIYSLKGNVAYARNLYEEQGLRPWMSSSKCWSNNKELAIKTNSNS